MQRLAIAVGATVVVAASLAAYFLMDQPEAPTVAEQPPAEQRAPEAMPPPQPPTEDEPQTAAAPNDSSPQPGDPDASSEKTDRPAIEVRPRAPQVAAGEKAAAEAPATTATAPAPSFDVVRIEKGGETVIAGRAAPDSDVNVTTQDGTSLGRARADSTGSWAIISEQPLPPGSHEIGIESESPEGGDARLSEEVVVVVVPEPAAPKAPAAARATAEASGKKDSQPPGRQVLAVLTPRQGGTSKVLPQAEEEDGIAQGDLVLDSVDYDDSGQAVVGGRAAPGTRMRVYLNNRLVGDAVAGADGRWSAEPEAPVGEGMHTLRVDQVGDDGKVVARVETPFSREAPRVAEADEEFVIVQPGNSLWRIARRTYGQGLQYTVIYQANRSQIRDPDLIYPGQVFELPKVN